MRRRKPLAEIRLQIRLYPGQDDELIGWLAQFDGRPYGAKSQAVKEALARGLGSHPGQSTGVATLCPSTAPAADLAEIRRVVEAAVTQALARFEGYVASAPAALQPDDETETLLDNMATALVLTDE